MSGRIARAVRGVTSPVRNYFNGHFEMLKQEVRQSRPAAPQPESEAWARVAELEAVVSEHAHHQARLLARVADELRAVAERLDALEREVRHEVVAEPEA